MDGVQTRSEERQCCLNSLFMHCCTALDALMPGTVQEWWVSYGMLNMINEAVCVFGTGGSPDKGQNAESAGKARGSRWLLSSQPLLSCCRVYTKAITSLKNILGLFYEAKPNRNRVAESVSRSLDVRHRPDPRPSSKARLNNWARLLEMWHFNNYCPFGG